MCQESPVYCNWVGVHQFPLGAAQHPSGRASRSRAIAHFHSASPRLVLSMSKQVWAPTAGARDPPILPARSSRLGEAAVT